MCIAHFDYPVKGSTIVRIMGYDPATVTRSTRILVEKGMLESQQNRNDARSVVFNLTEAGEQFTTAYRNVAKKMTRKLNVRDPSGPTQAELEHAVDVFVRIRDRSVQTTKLRYK